MGVVEIQRPRKVRVEEHEPSTRQNADSSKSDDTTGIG